MNFIVTPEMLIGLLVVFLIGAYSRLRWRRNRESDDHVIALAGLEAKLNSTERARADLKVKVEKLTKELDELAEKYQRVKTTNELLLNDQLLLWRTTFEPKLAEYTKLEGGCATLLRNLGVDDFVELGQILRSAGAKATLAVQRGEQLLREKSKLITLPGDDTGDALIRSIQEILKTSESSES